MCVQPGCHTGGGGKGGYPPPFNYDWVSIAGYWNNSWPFFSNIFWLLFSFPPSTSKSCMTPWQLLLDYMILYSPPCTGMSEEMMFPPCPHHDDPSTCMSQSSSWEEGADLTTSWRPIRMRGRGVTQPAAQLHLTSECNIISSVRLSALNRYGHCIYKNRSCFDVVHI